MQPVFDVFLRSAVQASLCKLSQPQRGVTTYDYSAVTTGRSGGIRRFESRQVHGHSPIVKCINTYCAGETPFSTITPRGTHTRDMYLLIVQTADDAYRHSAN